MLKLMDFNSIDNVIVYDDDTDVSQYYLAPQYPRFLMNPNTGLPNFSYVKYRLPISRPDGKRGGGLAFFGAELAVPPASEAKIRAACEDRTRRRRGLGAGAQVDVKLGRPTYTRGGVSISCLDSGGVLVEKINSVGVPSLFGNNAVSVSVEFSPEGAAVFEQVMQRQGNGMIKVDYSLFFYARLPDAQIVGDWNSQAFMSYSQTVNVEDRFWSEDDYSENINEFISKSESRSIGWIKPLVPTPGSDPATIEKIRLGIEDSVTNALNDGIKRNLLDAIPPESRDVSKIRDEGYENIRRTVTTNHVSSVHVEYKSASAIEQPSYPNSPLDAIGGMVVNGKKLDWNQFAAVVDADDPFFKSFKVRSQVNADFQNLPIFSVDMTWKYEPPGKPVVGDSYSFKKPEDLQNFDVYLDGGDGTYTYSYVVNYKGSDKTYKSPDIKTQSKVLTINVADLGIWVLDIEVGDINFDQVDRAQVMIWYEDGNDVPRIDYSFTLDKSTPKQEIRKLIFSPRNKPFHYKVKYFMKGGREIEGPEQEANGEQLYVNDPFSANRTISIRSKGDFDTRIDTLFLDFVYEDTANDYRQDKSFALSKAGKRFDDWTFPVISEKAGTLTYTGNILYKNGTSAAIAQKTVTGNTVLEGEDVIQLTVEIVPDLIDWTTTKLVTVLLEYSDPANSVTGRQSYTLRPNMAEPPAPWVLPIKDASKTEYQVTARFFLTDGTTKTLGPVAKTDTPLVLEVPA